MEAREVAEVPGTGVIISSERLSGCILCFVLFCFVLFWFGLVWFGLVWFGLVWLRQVYLCSPGCSGTYSVDQAGLKLRDPPASAF